MLSENTTGPTLNNATVTPGTREVAVNVNVAAPSDITVGIMIDSDNSTAEEGTDYSISAKSLTINATQTSGTITLTSMDNEDGAETPLQIVLMLTGGVPDGWTLGTTTHTVTIVDDDTAVGFTQATLDIDEPATTKNYDGDVGVRLTTTPAVAVTVTYEVIADLTTLPSGLVPSGAVAATTASGTGQDIEFPTNKTFTFSTTDTGADLTEALADVSIKADTDYEPDEYVVLKIMDHMSFKGSGNNFNIGPEYLVIKIPENDISMVGFVGAASSSFDESAGNRFVEIGAVPNFDSEITVNIAVSSESTAVEDEDYTFVDSLNAKTSLPSSLTIPMGMRAGFRVLPNDDTDDEPAKTLIFDITLPSSAPDGVVLDTSKSRRTLTIFDDDIPPNTISFAPDAPRTVARGGEAQISLEVAPGLTDPARVQIVVSGVSDTSGYTFLAPRMAEGESFDGNVAVIPTISLGNSFIILFTIPSGTADDSVTLTLMPDTTGFPPDWSLGSANASRTLTIDITD